MPLKATALCMAVVLACAVAFGSLSHSLIPHSHSHADEGSAIGWEILHSALRHEEKNTLTFIAADLLVLAVFAFLYGEVSARAQLVLKRKRYRGNIAHPLLQYVRTGAAAYRKFG